MTGRDAVPAELRSALSNAAQADGASLSAAHGVTTGALDFDPSSAQGLSLIQGSALALSDSQLGKLRENGLVIAKNKTFPNFVYGYKTIYAADLPVYVSADSILHAVHKSYDKVLEALELERLVPELGAMLDAARAQLPGSSLDKETASDVDLYLAVAASLLRGTTQSPVASADAEQVTRILEKAQVASGHENVSLFGVERDEDFSQFAVRGHYRNHPDLGKYFRAMMWLGRVDFRVIESQGDGSQVFHRRQFNAALALHEVLGASGREHWAHVDEVVGAFVGERDSATISDMTPLLTQLGAASLAETKALEDKKIVDAIIASGWGAQRIASRIIYKYSDNPETLPLDRSFTLLGQRYTVDSHVFVNTTYDRVASWNGKLRMMPDSLDVAFGALQNDAALALLEPQLENPSYAAGLASSRVLVDAHESSYWTGSLYTQWLGALRALSPRADDREKLPSVALTPAFRERILNTQLASWAELRRDTILYAKQSYTTGNACEFPDAYVDPYPEFYAQLGRFAQRVEQVVAGLPGPSGRMVQAVQSWTKNFVTVTGYLERMARNQQTGAPHDAELMAFINEAVRWDEIKNCDGTVLTSNLTGWYSKLFYSVDPVAFDPTIADVHTQPTDEGGADVGRVLHVGTGYSRLMVVTVNTCNGPRAYAGLASSYAEKITDNWKRLNDESWAAEITNPDAFPDVPWMKRVLAD